MSNKNDRKRSHIGSSGRIRGMFLLMIGLAIHGMTVAQTYAPLRYWTFDGANALTDSMGNFNMNPNYYGSPYTISTNPTGVGVGKHLTLDGASTLIQLGQLATDSAFTIEFLMKPGYLFSDSRIFTRVDGSMEARMGYPYIIFTTKINLTGGGTSTDDMQVDLNLIGRRSYGYYVDGNWHHIVFRYNSKTGLKQIWVDGECPAGFYKTTATGSIANTSTTGKDLLLNTQSTYVKYHGGYDEMALYAYWLPDNMIYKHYTEFLQGRHYSFSWTTTAPPTPASVTGTVDINEYAPGHPTVSVSATDQLLSYPTPRYKTGHTLLPNIPLYGVEQLGGLMQTGVTYTQALNEAKIQQSDLIRNFNQALQITSNSHEYPYYGDTTKFAGYFLKLANNNPTWSTCINTFWPQVTPTLAGYASSQPYITCNCNSANHYLRNSSGQFLDSYGNVTTSTKTFSPEAPTDSLIKDGMTQRFYLNQLLSRLTRPLNLIFENGEVIPFINNSTTLTKDPAVASAQAASGLDWYTYEGRKAKEKVLSYRNQFMSLSGLANTKFAYFQVDGQPTWRFKYSEMRQTNSLINGQYYPTGDIYMRYPDNWRYWSSAWHGWQWVVESRKVELAAGDKLYSPPVAAGWDINEENNIRPAQWLGMLKAFSMTGAEFFYPSFFALSSPYPPAKNWVWQVIMPAYAQGITSRYEDFLRNGYLMEGDVPNSPSNPQWNAYSFKSGDFRKLVVVRKHNTINKYAITGTLQPNSNLMGNAENEGTAAISLDGLTVKFKVRRQGSTYIYDKSVPSEPVFYQLDSWHEASHPSYWSKDFVFEAELYDNTNSQVSIKTSVPAGTAAGDFTNYTSYISFATASDVVYNFVARKNAPLKYHFWIRARSIDGSATGVNVSLNGANTQKIDCIRDTNWVWYRYDINSAPVAFAGITQQNYMLSISALTNKLQIDKIALIENSGAVYSTVTNTCTSASATITPSGATSFCQGGSVTLTANTGAAYLWSTGATTQSITVTASGNYTVKVTASGGTSATSAPTTVTVYSLPAASITAGGATTFCQGSSVTLTAPAASSYLWLPGNQTTQAITVTAAGSYSVRITNSNGCSSTSSATTVTVNALPSATISAGGSTTFCQGGSVTLTSAAGTSYLWSPGNQTTQAITANASGSYTVRVTNSNGCSATSSATTVTVNTLPTATTSPSGNISITSGSSATITASTGSSYLWTPGGQTTSSISVNTAGSYTVRVTNASGCSATSAPVIVSVNSTTPVATITPSGSTSFCQGNSVTLSANSGTAYLWNTGATTQSITTGSSGTYTVTVTAASGGSAVSSPVTVTVYALPSATTTASGATTFCQGGSVTLTSSAGSSYLWTPGNQTTQSISATTSGTYSVRVTNSNGCSATSSGRVVTVNPLPTATTSPSGSVSINSGSSTTLTASAGTSYLWSPGNQTTQSITVSTAGSYTVRVTNSYGCSATSAAVNVSVNSTTTCPMPTNLVTSNVTSNSAELAWQNPGGGVTEFNVRLRNMTTGFYYTTGNVPSSTISITVGANSSTTYRWWVRSWCGTTRSSYAGYLTFITPSPRIDDPGYSEGTYNEPLFEDPEAFGDEPTVVLEMDQVNLYPNPASSVSTLSYYSARDAKFLVSITDLTGKVIFRETLEAAEGFNLVDLDLSGLSKGVYMVRLSGDSQNVNKRLSVQ